MDIGVLYIATGEKYLKEVLLSAGSLKKWMPLIPIALITDKPFSNALIDQVIEEPLQLDESEKNWKGFINYKIKGFSLSPFERTVFLDSDTFVIKDFSELFEMLHYFDLLVTKDMSDAAEICLNGHTLKNYTPYNTGVVGFRKSASTDQFLKDWEKYYRLHIEEYWSDQPAFMHALALNNVKSYCLHGNYNFRFLTNVCLLNKSEVKIIHGRASKKEFEHIADVVNKTLSQRAWIASLRKMYDWNTRNWRDSIRKVFNSTFRR